MKVKRNCHFVHPSVDKYVLAKSESMNQTKAVSYEFQNQKRKANTLGEKLCVKP